MSLYCRLVPLPFSGLRCVPSTFRIPPTSLNDFDYRQAVYLLMPSSDKSVHHAVQGHNNGVAGSYVPKDGEAAQEPAHSEPVITTDDEGTELPEAEIKQSLKVAYVRCHCTIVHTIAYSFYVRPATPPVTERPSWVAFTFARHSIVTDVIISQPIGKDLTESLSDDEGNKISISKAEESKAHSDVRVHIGDNCTALTTLYLCQVDSPKDAQSAEDKGQRFDNGAPGQDEHSEKDVEQKEKPKPRDNGDDGDNSAPSGGGYTSTPKDLGEARKPGTSVRELSMRMSFPTLIPPQSGTSSGQAPGEREH
jgi:hypothetical protein